METKSFVAQVKTYFGFLPGQTLGEFVAEVKAISEKDRKELAEMLTAAGYPVDMAKL